MEDTDNNQENKQDHLILGSVMNNETAQHTQEMGQFHEPGDLNRYQGLWWEMGPQGVTKGPSKLLPVCTQQTKVLGGETMCLSLHSEQWPHSNQASGSWARLLSPPWGWQPGHHWRNQCVSCTARSAVCASMTHAKQQKVL